MSDRLSSALQVHEGVWTNWSKGWARGYTLTLTQANGTLLTSALALFVALSGSQLWTIIRFGLHQLRTSRRPESTETNVQQRVVLRNATTDFTTMLLMADLAWTAHRKTGRVLPFSTSIAVFAILHYFLFVIAGTFSGPLVNAGADALSNSPGCGVWKPDYYRDVVEYPYVNLANLSVLDLSLKRMNGVFQDIEFSLEYARECYDPPSPKALSSICSTFPNRRLPFTSSVLDEGCPFGEGQCHKDSQSIVFDTGLVNSHLHLGMNAPVHDRLDYRRVTTCAVMNDTNRIFDQVTPADSGDNVAAHVITSAYYGPQFFQIDFNASSNLTYTYSNLRDFYSKFTVANTITPYTVSTAVALANSSMEDIISTFDPIPELKHPSADLNLFFLSFEGRYFCPIDDPWFSAHNLHQLRTRSSIADIQYARDRNVSTMACMEQHQLCTYKKCTTLHGYGQLHEDVSQHFSGTFSDIQKVTYDRLRSVLDNAGIAQVTWALAALRSPVLAAEKAVRQQSVISLPLPDDQWQLEATWWHTIAMSMIQRRIMLWATGAISPESRFLVPPQSKGDKWFCRNVMVPSSGHLSLSVLSLAVLIICGFVIILAAWHIEALSGWYLTRSGRGIGLRRVWDEDDMLSLRSCVNRCSWRPQTPPKDNDYGINQSLDSEKAASTS